MRITNFIVPAKAGIQIELRKILSGWIPAFAGMTGGGAQ
jgi:hypothetical protein